MVLNWYFPPDPVIYFYAKFWYAFANKSLTRGSRLFYSIVQSVNYGWSKMIYFRIQKYKNTNHCVENVCTEKKSD